MKTTIAVVGMLLSATSQATTYSGTVFDVQAQASPTTTGNIRISIHTGNTTSCTGLAGYYSFDYPSASVASTWEAILLSAIVTNKSVKIVGTGVCDAFGLETVSIIFALS